MYSGFALFLFLFFVFILEGGLIFQKKINQKV